MFGNDCGCGCRGRKSQNSGNYMVQRMKEEVADMLKKIRI